MSWNGATAVRSWKLLAGPRAGALEPAGSKRKTGFETALEPPPGSRYAKAVALDARGKELGRSKPVRI